MQTSTRGCSRQSQLIATLQKCGVAILCLRIHISGVLQELADNFCVTESDQLAECCNPAIDYIQYMYIYVYIIYIYICTTIYQICIKIHSMLPHVPQKKSPWQKGYQVCGKCLEAGQKCKMTSSCCVLKLEGPRYPWQPNDAFRMAKTRLCCGRHQWSFAIPEQLRCSDTAGTSLITWVCLKIGYIPNYSHLIGIMIINHWV